MLEVANEPNIFSPWKIKNKNERRKWGTPSTIKINCITDIFTHPPCFSSAVLVLPNISLQFSQTSALHRKRMRENKGNGRISRLYKI